MTEHGRQPAAPVATPDAPPVTVVAPPAKPSSNGSTPHLVALPRVSPASARHLLFGARRWIIAGGLFVIGFLVFEFALSGLLTQRTQDALVGDYRDAITSGLAATTAAPAEGAATALLDIPSLDVHDVVVEGTSTQDLKRGPGHLRGSPQPGEFGNVVILGRRTTYGAPFRHLDQLGPHDTVTLITGTGSFEYDVTSVERTGAGSADALNGTTDSRLTLVTSDSAYFPSGRLVVVAKLRGTPLDVSTVSQPLYDPDELGLSGDVLGFGLGLVWLLLLVAVVWVQPRLPREWPSRVRYLLTTPVVAALILLIFTSVDRLLPSTM